MRYESRPCAEETPDLLCANCRWARCVVMTFAADGGVEHVDWDDLVFVDAEGKS